jgi:hypothetical protein
MRSRVLKLFMSIPLLLFLAAIAFSCSSRYIFLRHTDLYVDQPVQITLKDGSTVSGQIANVAQEKIDLLLKNGTHRAIEQTDVGCCRGPEPIFDTQGNFISESEIQAAIHSKNCTAHAVFGGLISLGVSFVAASLVSQEAVTDHRQFFTVALTTAGGAFSTLRFAQSGALKDREVAIEKILKERNELALDAAVPDEADDLLIKERILALRREQQDHLEEIAKLKKEIESFDQNGRTSN